MARKGDPGFGLVLFDERIAASTLASVGAGANDSAYTQDGPLPGTAVSEDEASTWRPQLTVAQSVALELLTLRGGYAGRTGPSRRGAAGVAYRLDSETTDEDWRGWEEPCLVTDWDTPTNAWGAAETWAEGAIATIPSTQQVIVVARSPSTGRCWIYEPRTGTFANGESFSIGLDAPLAVAVDPTTERVILWSGGTTSGGYRLSLAYQSSDVGANFVRYARGIYDQGIGSAAFGIGGVAVDADLDWLMCGNDGQWASSDHGITWERVQTSLDGSGHCPVRTPQGWAVAYVSSSGDPAVRVLASARSPFNSAAEVSLSTTDSAQIKACVDADGVLYVLSCGTNGASARGVAQLFRSADGGNTFEEYDDNAWDLGNTAYCTLGGLTAACGSLYALCFGAGHADVAGTWNLIRLGGWSNVEHGANADDSPVDRHVNRCGFQGSNGAGYGYLPWDVPQNMGWTRIVGAGTQSLSDAEPGFMLTCTQLQQDQYTFPAFVAGNWAAGSACVRVSATTPALGSGGVINDSGLIIGATTDDGVTAYTLQIHLGSDGIRTQDSTTVRDTVALDLTQWTHIRWYIRPGGASVWYRQGAGTKWTRLSNNMTLTGAASTSTGTRCTWGHALAGVVGTADLWVRYLGQASDGTWLQGLDTAGELDDSYSDGVRGLMFGRDVPSRGDGLGYPIPDATSTSEDVGRLIGSGRTYAGEDVELPVAYAYPVARVHPADAPSPLLEWRATGSTEVRLVWDQGADARAAWWGSALALLVLGGSFRLCTLERDDGSGGWTVLGTLDKGLSSVNYTLSGSVAIPRSGTATVDRYLGEDDLRGGYLVCSTAGSPVARRIRRSTPGYWSTDTGLQQVRLELEDVDGTETAAGTGELVWPSGLLVCYPSSEPARRRIRCVIASGQVTPGGTYRAGLLAPGRVAAVGSDPAWDWRLQRELQRDQEADARGTDVYVRRGPPRDLLTYGWPDGVALQELRTLADAGDYYAISGAQPLATEEDTAHSVLAWLDGALRSGELPVCVVPRLPSSSGTTLTDPTLYYYGLLDSESLGVSAIRGTEGSDEWLRVDSIAVRTLPWEHPR